MKNLKRITTAVVLLWSVATGFAQQDAMFTHYMDNTLWLNPAYAGSREALTVTGLHRSQWVGFDGAPTTQTITMHTPIFSEKLGIGLSVLNDKIGPTQSTTINADIAYHLKLDDKSKLAFGIKAGLNIFSNALTPLKLDQGNDNSFASNFQSELLPNFGFGMYYYRPKFYVGLSTPRLVENKINQGLVTSTSLSSERRHYFLIAGAVFDLTKDLKLKPTGFLKVTEAAPIQGDITLTLLCQDKYWAGLMYRSLDAAGVLVGANITEQLGIGYSFDWSFTNATGKYNSGSHEIMLRYDFIFKEKAKIKSPRYF